MEEYTKIQTLFKRDENGKIIEWMWSRDEFEYLADLKWNVTEKIDGTNICVEWDGCDFKFYGRRQKSEIPEGIFQTRDITFTVKDMGRGYKRRVYCTIIQV